MNQREIKKQIRDLGLRAEYDPEFEEWRLTTDDNSEDNAYYTDSDEDVLSTAKYMARELAENPRACALPGTLSTKTRDKLPAKAFGLPKERKYPMYKLGRDGSLIPSGSHASNAKARAQAEYNDGRLSKKKLMQIDRKADKVLRECGTKGRPRKKNRPEDGALVFHAKTRGGKYEIKVFRKGDDYTARYYTSGRESGSAVGYTRDQMRSRIRKAVADASSIDNIKYAVVVDSLMPRSRKNNPGPNTGTTGALVGRLKF